MEKSIWLIGGDGWAYDIGFGGLDHASEFDGKRQHSGAGYAMLFHIPVVRRRKRTPLGAVTKFDEHGKRKARKDLGVSMMMYGHVYVAQISLGAQLNQTVKAIQEAEAYPGHR
ncbi:hypothetical protein O5541_02785 [Escherichia coli]|nr:hypothetical protein [Escherichia coli]